MLYFVLKNLSRFGFKAYFKKIYITGTEHIPEDQPVIFAANHTNGLVDPVAIGVHLPYPIHFITRGDVFTPLTEPIFKRLNMMPIYRIRDGYHLLAKNNETFARSYEILKKGEKIIIFSEGDCASEKQLRPLKKGTARMAFEAYTSHDADAVIIPVSLNYTKHTGFRSELMMHFHEGFQTSDFKEILAENKARAIRAFNKELKSRMQEDIVHLDNLEHKDFLEKLLAIKRSELNIPILPILDRKDTNRLHTEKQVSNWLNLHSVENEQFNDIKKDVFQLEHQLKKHKLTFSAFGKKSHPLLLILLLLVFPLIVLVLVANSATYWLANSLTKVKVKQDIFVSTFRCFLMVFTYIPFLLILMIIGILIWGWWTVPVLLLMPLLTILSLSYKDWLQLEWHKLKYAWFKRRNPEKNVELTQTKERILQILKDK